MKVIKTNMKYLLVLVFLVGSSTLNAAKPVDKDKDYATQAKLDAEESARIAADNNLQTQIGTIELTPGPKGDKGDKGDTGDTGADSTVAGPKGDKGDKGDTGDSGTSAWTDGDGVVSTTGRVDNGSSVQIGDEDVACDSTTAGTIRFNTTTMIFEGCNGAEWVAIRTWACGLPIQDGRDGKWYDTVKIGHQCWMAQNLNVGIMGAGKFCYDPDPIANCLAYGGLYTWDGMMDGSTTEGAQGLCPTGWHVPTDDEWKTLEMALGMTQAEADWGDYRGTDQGTQLKVGGGSGFEAMLAGIRGVAGDFHDQGIQTWFWTSSVSPGLGLQGMARGLYRTDPDPTQNPPHHTQVSRLTYDKPVGFSVRCVKD